VVFKKNDSSQGERDVTCDVDDEIPQDAIRRMGVGFICPIEGHLVADREEVCSTQVEPSSTQVQKASPEEATNAPTEEQDKDLREEEGGHHPFWRFQPPLIIPKTKINLLMKRVMMCSMMIKVKLMVKTGTKMIK
jgi:hypothetical protein